MLNSSALHHHPLSSTLYLLLSYHHLHPNSPFPGSSIPSTSKLDLPSVSIDDQEEEDDAEATGFSLEGTASARTNILLGLRMIPKSHDLWREYIKLELGWVEGLRRRWKVLGVNIESKPAPGSEVDPNALTGGEGSFGPDGEDARKSILSGQLIIHAINSALAAIPSSEAEGMEFRESLVRLLRIYPSALRTKCLEVVYSDLEGIAESAGDEATRARFMVLTKELYDRPYSPGTKDEGGVVLEGAELVDAIGRIGKEIRAVAKSGKGGSAWLDMAGQWLVQQMALCGDNTDLVSDDIPA
jgi:U3 small nucleolar RNA-associated protein 6